MSPTFNVSFNDAAGTYSQYYSKLTNSIVNAGTAWTRALGLTRSVGIEIQVNFDSNLNAIGSSLAGAYPKVGTLSGVDVLESNISVELQTGNDVNGASPDGVFTINPKYLSYSTYDVLTEHEFGHFLGFSGLRNDQTGQLSTANETTFDRYVISQGGNLYFIGPNAMAVYGGPVPLALGDYGHVGQGPAQTGPGGDLNTDLMSIGPQTLHISALDFAIVSDTMDISRLTIGTSSPSNTAPIFRFFDTIHGTHLYTSNVAEKFNVMADRQDLLYEGTGLNAIANQNLDSNAAPVYRFFSNIDGTHFFTASATERDDLLVKRQDLKFEGTAFYEHVTQQSGDTPVYRFFERADGTHFYTSSGSERDGLIATRSSDLVYEGVGFYAPSGS